MLIDITILGMCILYGAYNMGEPAPTVQKMKNLVYTSNVTDGDTQSTKGNLGVFIYSNYLYEKQNHIKTINYDYATNMWKNH